MKKKKWIFLIVFVTLTAAVWTAQTENKTEPLSIEQRIAGVLSEWNRLDRPGISVTVVKDGKVVFQKAFGLASMEHHIPITDRMLAEALKMVGLEVSEIHPRFLPYTTRSSIPKHPFLVRLYLKFTPIWQIMGGQFWLVAVKPQVAGSVNA